MSLSPDLIALSLIPINRWRSVTELLRDGTSPGVVLERLCSDVRPVRGRLPAWADAGRLRALAAQAWQRAREAEPCIGAVGWDDPAFPAAWRSLPDPPPVLWVRGDVAALSGIAVAIVGSRAASAYARAVAERLAADLARAGIVVVSGLARGVDAAAHRGALAGPGVTVGVLGCGVDVAYPPEHRALMDQVARSGAVISEFLPGASPRPDFFPRRNRLISGLVRGVVVVEAGDRSGSLITARCAAEQGRDVMAVPGNVLGGHNRGGHALLRDGARLVESADDVLDELGWRGTRLPPDAAIGARTADPLLACLTPGESASLEEICARSGLSPTGVLPRLLGFELGGIVAREPGGRFIRVDKTC